MEKIFAPDGALEAFDFDTMLFPTSFATWHAGNFGPQVLAAADDLTRRTGTPCRGRS